MSETDQYSEDLVFPTREGFLANERSKAIREVCIKILRIVNDLFDGTNETENREERLNPYAQLEHLNGELIGLGIYRDMNSTADQKNIGVPESVLMQRSTDPVHLAEFLAGQVIGLTGTMIASRARVESATREFSDCITKLDDARVYSCPMEGISRQMLESGCALSSFNIAVRRFDADLEVFGRNIEE